MIVDDEVSCLIIVLIAELVFEPLINFFFFQKTSYSPVTWKEKENNTRSTNLKTLITNLWTAKLSFSVFQNELLIKVRGLRKYVLKFD